MSIGSFSNPITGSNGDLVYNQIQSPNFVHGVSGWRIQRNGSAEFQNVIIPVGSGGAVTTFASTAPLSPHVGDIWYDTSNGLLEHQWNGTIWAPFQIGTGAIATGSITAALITANTITAGQIAANTITSGQIKAGTITGIYTGAAYFGQNMIQDPAFSSSLLNSVRTGDPVTNASWTLSGGTASVTSGTPAKRLALMPSTQPDFFCTPGEQFFMQVTATTSASAQVGIEINYNNGALSTISSTFSGTQTVSGSVTVPAGATSGYVRMFTFAASGSPTVTMSNPAIYIGQLLGPDYILNQNGYFLYAGVPSSTNLAASIANASGTDTLGNAYLPGMALYGPGNSTVNMGWTTTTKTSQPVLVLFPDSSFAYTGNAPFVTALNTNKGLATEFNQITVSSGNPPSTSAQSQIDMYSGSPDGTTSIPHISFFGGNTGTLMADIAPTGINITRGSGMQGAVPIVTTDTTDDTNANNGTQPMTQGWSIPANDAKVGTVYTVETSFDGVTGTASTGGLGFKPGLNGAIVTGGTSGGDTIGSALFGTNVGFTGNVRVKMVIKTTGVSGTADFFINGGATQNASATGTNNAFLSSQATAVTINTTTSNTLGIRSSWGSNIAGQTVTGHGSVFTRMGPG
jgi:hypothetical protein